MSFDAQASGVDVLVVSAHKWLMGPRGIGFAAFSDHALAQITPRIVGWLSVNDPFGFNRTLEFLPDARRFEAGMPNATGVFGLSERLTQIDELGMDWIGTRVVDLNAMLREEARRAGLELAYDVERERSSGIALVRKPGVETTKVLARLNENRIYASVRGGAIRVAPHCHNTQSEIERVVTVIASTPA